MFKRFKVHEKYKIRHLILGHLYKKLENEPHYSIDLNKSKSNSVEIANALNISVDKFGKYHEALHIDKHVTCKSENGNHILYIREDGIIAFIDEHWLKQGINEVNDNIYNISKWLVPLLALIITAGSLIFTIVTVKQTQKEVQQLKSKIEKLQR